MRKRESTLVAAATAVVVVVVEVEVGVRVVCSEAWRGFVPAPLPCTCPNTRPPLTCPRPPHSLPPSFLAPRPPTYIYAHIILFIALPPAHSLSQSYLNTLTHSSHIHTYIQYNILLVTVCPYLSTHTIPINTLSFYTPLNSTLSSPHLPDRKH